MTRFTAILTALLLTGISSSAPADKNNDVSYTERGTSSVIGTTYGQVKETCSYFSGESNTRRVIYTMACKDAEAEVKWDSSLRRVNHYCGEALVYVKSVPADLTYFNVNKPGNSEYGLIFAGNGPCK
jgi:hypothetical protein